MPLDPTVAPIAGGVDFDQQLQTDCESVRELMAGVERLESEMYAMKKVGLAQRLGYFPPDHEDRVKQMLLSYRNHRFAMFEVTHRYHGYRGIEPEERRLGAFMIAYATALSLYTKSLAVVGAFEHVPLVRQKLDEPDEKIGLEGGFFDTLLRGYSSVANYRLLARGTRFWRDHRREAERLGLARRPGWEWLPDFIRQERRKLSLRFRHVLRPGLSSGDLAAALIGTFSLLGKPYDYDFDFNHSQRIVCTEIIYRMYHHRGSLSFELVKRLGRWTLSADDIMSQALVALVETMDRGSAPLQPVALALTGNDQQTRFVDRQALLATLLRFQFGWRPYRVPAAVPANPVN